VFFPATTAATFAFTQPNFQSRISSQTDYPVISVSLPQISVVPLEKSLLSAFPLFSSSNPSIGEDGKCVFGRKSYWDGMYNGEDGDGSNSSSGGNFEGPAEAYSWYCQYEELAPFWKMLVPSTNARVLIAGIGNDPAPIDMYDDGWTDMIAFDYSEAGVRRAKTLFGSSRLDSSNADKTGGSGTARLLVADARDLPIPSSSIDATLDKGTLDAIHITGKEIFQDSVRELSRVTAEDGVVVCISRVIPPEDLFEAFTSELWEMTHDGSLAFAPDGEATIDLGAELYSWKRKSAIYSTEDR